MSKTTRSRGTGASGPCAPASSAPLQAARYDRIDALRGAALIWMAAFHFCFDLANWHLLQANFYTDGLWTGQRTCILSTFLLCAGAGQAVAHAQGQTWGRFWRRWAQIVGCAGLVSLGSWWMFPDSYISFGVLHGMAVMLIIARLTARLGGLLWPLGAVAVALPQLVSHAWFDSRATNWMGLVTHKPITEDFVPVLPWLGVMWWGVAGTQWLLAHRAADLASHARPSAWWRALVRLGQWSLTFYMVHQPVMLAILAASLWLMGRPIPS